MKDMNDKTMPARLGCIALALAALGGCAAQQTMPDRTAPALAASWKQQGEAVPASVSPQWWQAFGSTELGGMVQAAQDQSLRSEEHTSELQSHSDLVCRLLLAKNNKLK